MVDFPSFELLNVNGLYESSSYALKFSLRFYNAATY